MHFNKLLFCLIIISSCKNSIVLPYKHISVSILEKYRLQDADIFLEKGKLEFSNKYFEVKDEKIVISRSGHNIVVSFRNKSHNANYVKFSPDEKLNIKFNYKETHSRNYSGFVEVYVYKDYMRFVNKTYVEDYVHGAAISEIGFFLVGKNPDKSKREFLEAMKIAIRSYVFHFKDRHKNEDYQFCDLTHCVHFKGFHGPMRNKKSKYPVMLDEDNNFLCSYFHSTSGGKLTGPEVFWYKHSLYKNFQRGRDRLYFWSRSLSEKSPHYNWETYVPFSEMYSILNSKGLHKFKPEYEQGRVSFLLYEDLKGKKYRLSISAFMSRAGRLIGWNKIKSNDFSIAKSSNGLVFKGNGLGHGVGLCQWGAWEMATHGYSHKDILNFYYNSPKVVEGMYK